MGSTISSPSPTINNEDVMNAILQYMLNEIKIRDFIALSDANECKKYITLMANDMYRHFYELKLVPEANPKGLLLFRKIDELTTPVSQTEVQHRQSLCVVLAYYYVRIFQIYGSLALTIIDDAEYMKKIGLPQTVQSAQKSATPLSYNRGMPAPGNPGFVQKAGQMLKAFDQQKGGNGNGKLGIFQIFESYLDNVNISSRKFKTKYKYEDIYFSLVENKPPIEHGKFEFTYKGSSNTFFLPIKIVETSLQYMINYDKVFYYDITLQPRQLDKIPLIDSKTITKNSTGAPYVGSESLETYFTNLFTKLIQDLKQFDYKKDAYVPQTATPVIRNASVEKFMDIEKLKANLRQYRPQAHCIARAMQLLSTKPIDNKTVVSHICKTKFFEATRGATRSGIPEAGDKLSESPGIYALSQLFYDLITDGTPKLHIDTEKTHTGAVSSMEQYVYFMRIMAKRFGDDSNEKEAIRLKDSYAAGVDGIQNLRDSKVCKNMTDDIIIKSESSGAVQKYVDELISTQRTHAANCMEIINKIFNISRDSRGRISVTLHKNIIVGGIPAINNIAFEARALLIQYYSDCEKSYINGMKAVISADKAPVANVAKSVPTTSRVLNRLKKNAGPLTM